MRQLRSQVVLFIPLLLFIGLGVAAIWQWCPIPVSAQGITDYKPAAYIGKASCIECHQQQHELWTGSHHDLAMQVADEKTVLGDFDNATFVHNGVTTTFTGKDGKFFVNTEGPDGELHDYEVAYTFGVTPLQQYLIPFPNGRYQVLGVCWDSRPESEGGQRWYHLYGDEPIPHNDPLHWTGPNQNWNFMCAECHSTELKKNYDEATDSFNTSWSEINVSCESCHGPGSNHAAWAKAGQTDKEGDGSMGLVLRIKDDGGFWRFQPGADTAQRTQPREDQTMLNMCARCHSRRSVVTEDYRHGKGLLDTHRPALLTENLYHADGQVLDEVYVYGSFLQSRMYQAGVTCTDCHDPHSMQVYSQGNSLCATCHMPSTFDTPRHHFHEQGTESSRCVSCHMPTKTYMGIDARLDHSIRVPRPDLSAKLGVPNACNQCHTDQTHEWAEAAVTKWYGADHRNEPHYGEVLHAGRTGSPDADKMLAALTTDMTQTGIVRSTALSLLRNYPTPLSYQTIQSQARDDDPMVRFAALNALEVTGPNLRLPVAYELLQDPVLSVRLEAARVLAPVDPSQLNDEQRQAIEQGIEAYIQSQRVNADRAESHLNIALIHTQRGRNDLAEQSYRTALTINPAFAQAYVNLSDLYRGTNRNELSTRVLNEAVEAGVEYGVIYYSLGLALVREAKTPEAIRAFERAAELAPDDPQFSYTLGIALNSTGDTERAIEVLDETHRRHPTYQPALYALMTISRDRGEAQAAVRYAQSLLELNPNDPKPIEAFIEQVKSSIPE